VVKPLPIPPSFLISRSHMANVKAKAHVFFVKWASQRFTRERRKKNMFLGARSFEFVNLTYEKTSKVKVWVVERL
jgi:hypothetical protein